MHRPCVVLLQACYRHYFSTTCCSKTQQSTMSFSSTQLRAMAISPKVSASLSIPGSLFILKETFSDYRESRRTGQRASTSMQRALAGMSVVDILSSLAWFFSTWAAPKESGALHASGNEVTCQIQGFFLQVAIGGPMYNGALILYYLLTIKYHWDSEDLARLEPWMHAFIWIWCIGTSMAVWALDLLNFIGPVCWIADPSECLEEEIPNGVECNKAKRYSTTLFCVPLWIVILLTIYALGEIYVTVRKTIRKMENRTEAGSRVNSLRRSSRDLEAVSIRAVLYSLAFIFTWTSSTIWSVAQWFDYFPFWVSYMWTVFEPLQGFWNCCIFLYNRPKSRRRLLSVIRRLVCLPAVPEFSEHAGSTSRSGRSRVSRKESCSGENKSGTARQESSRISVTEQSHPRNATTVPETLHETSHSRQDPVMITEVTPATEEA